MEWLYIVGLIGYYLYRAYAKGIEKSTEKENNTSKPIQPIGERKKEKTLDEILKELVENANKQNNNAPVPKKSTETKVLEEKKKVLKEEQKGKPAVKQHTVKKDAKLDSLLHKKKDYETSIEYDDSIEKILNNELDSVESGGITASSKLGKEIGNHIERTYQEKLVKINGKSMSPKDLVIAQIIFDRKYA